MLANALSSLQGRLPAGSVRRRPFTLGCLGISPPKINRSGPKKLKGVWGPSPARSDRLGSFWSTSTHITSHSYAGTSGFLRWEAFNRGDEYNLLRSVERICIKAGPDKGKAAMLVLLVALRIGRKVVLAVNSGYRESTETLSASAAGTLRTGTAGRCGVCS